MIRIPISEYKTYFLEGEPYFTYVTDEQIKKHHPFKYNEFNKWIENQTCPLVENKFVFYTWDYEKWLTILQTEEGK